VTISKKIFFTLPLVYCRYHAGRYIRAGVIRAVAKFDPFSVTRSMRPRSLFERRACRIHRAAAFVLFSLLGVIALWSFIKGLAKRLA